MATSMRLLRTGTTKRPVYRLVVIDKSKANKGGIIENLGMVDSRAELKHDIKEDRTLAWLKQGADPSDTTKNLLKKTGIWAKFAVPKPAKPKKVKAPKALPKAAKK